MNTPVHHLKSHPGDAARPRLFRLRSLLQLLLLPLMLCAAAQASAQTYALTNVWYVPTNVLGAANIIVNGDNNRALAYDAISNQVFVSSRQGSAPAPGIQVLDGATGATLGLMDKTGVSGGSIQVLNQIRVADDGAIYAANWTAPTPASFVKIYRWANWLSVPTVAYAGHATSNTATAGGFNLGATRVGDSMAIRGAGANTQIILPVGVGGVTATTNFLFFTTTDGLNFSNHILTVSGFTGSGSGIYGISFYTNNTFLIRLSGATGNNLLLVQYPANIGSLGEGPVAGTVLGSFALPSVLSTAAHIDYKSAGPGGFLAVMSPQNAGGASAAAQVALYLDPVLGNGPCPVQQATTNYPHLASNGNLAGAVALGGPTFSQFIYSLDCNNGVRCSAIVTIPPQPPTISTQPVGLTGNGAYAPYTLSVTANGFCPLVYQWQASTNNTTNASSFVNIPGATASTYTIATASTNYYRVFITNTIAPAVTSAVVQVAVKAAVSNAAVSQLWRVPAGTAGYTAFLNADNNGRGIAYDTNSQRVVVSYVNAAAAYVLDANTGALLGSLSTSGLATGAGAVFNIDQVGIADDGAVYTCNLSVAPSGFQNPVVINRWSSPTVGATPIAAYNGVPSGVGERYGDNMAVRGAGPNTQILLASSSSPISGVGPGTNVLLFTTSDGTNFNALSIGVTGVPNGFANSGIAFGDGDSFWAKSYNGNLFKIGFDPLTGSNYVMFSYSAVPNTTMGLAVDPTLSILATIVQSDVPDDVQLFQLTGSAAPPVLFHQGLMSNNANVNANGAVVMKAKRLYALDVNNGILALNYDVPVATPPAITTPPASVTAYTNAAAYFSVVASGTLTLNYQWRSNGIPISGATASTYVFANPPLSASGSLYDVVVQNTAGSVTSTPPAVLTVKAPVLSPVVTNMWSAAPNSISSIPTLDDSTYIARGLAFDPLTGRLLIADHFNIFALDATNQTYLENLNVAGVPDVGLSSWVFGQIRVADDGAVYACNIQDETFRPNTLCITRWSDATSGASLYSAWGGFTGADPSGSSERMGDTMAIRGGGADTQILMGTTAARKVVLFTTLNGLDFTPVVIEVTNAPIGFASGGVAFGAGTNTFWAKGGAGYNLREVTFDLNDPTKAYVSKSFTAATQVPNTMTGLGVDTARNVLVGVNFDNTPDDLELFLLSGNSNPPALVHQAFFPSANANVSLYSAVDIKYPWAFGLDVNNGIVALNYGAPAAPPVTITSVTRSGSNTTINWNNCFEGHSYQVEYKNLLSDLTWTPIGAPVPTSGPTGTFIDTTATGDTRFYRVVTQ
jgi:hypothetical protein